MRGFLIAIIVLGAVSCTGCQGMMPRWGSPGTLDAQRRRAILHDPYIDNNLGPPVDGVRPREFEKPEAETLRSRAYRDSRGLGIF